MKLALISLSKEDPEEGGPVGLLPLFDSNIVEKQVRCALKMGAEKIVFLCPMMPGAILQYMDALKARGMDAEIVRRASDLVQYASHDNQLIFIGDGILPSQVIEKNIAGQAGDIVYVVANSEIYEDLERIDLNQRWLGLLVLKASHLSTLIDIPDDWNIGSALLRIAIQAECPRQLVSDPQMVSGEVIHLENKAEATEYTKRKLANPEYNKGNLLDRFVFWPITRRILPKLWQTSAARLYLRGTTVFTALLASLAGYFELTILALALLFVASIIYTVGQRTDLFSIATSRWHPFDFAASIISKVVMILLVLSASSGAAIVPNMIILILIWINIPTIDRLADLSVLRIIRPDNSLPILILLLTAIFGHFLFGIYFVALWSSLYIGVTRYLSAEREQKPSTPT